MPNKKLSFFVLLLYATLLLVGGIMGHLKASRVSLVAGTLSSLLVIIAAIVSYKGRFWGSLLALVTSLSLFTLFIYRYFLSYKFMPAGLMTLLSLGVLLYLSVNICRHLWLSPKKAAVDAADHAAAASPQRLTKNRPQSK